MTRKKAKFPIPSKVKADQEVTTTDDVGKNNDDSYLCWICNSGLKINGPVDEIGDSNVFKKSRDRKRGTIEKLCSMFGFPLEILDVKITSPSSLTNIRSTADISELGSPFCNICKTYVNEFFRHERQVNELLRQMQRLRRGIGSLIVETFPSTPSDVKNYPLKKRVYEDWFPKIHNPPWPCFYRSHSQLLFENGNVHKSSSSRTPKSNQKINTHTGSITNQLKRTLNSEYEPSIVFEKDSEGVNNDDDSATPIPSPFYVDQAVDSEIEDSNDLTDPDIPTDIDTIPTTHATDNAPKTSKMNDDGSEMQKKGHVKIGESHPDSGKSVTEGNQPPKLTKKIYKCPYCSKSTAFKPIHDEHVKSHKGEMLFGCQFCSKKFRSSRNTKLHEMHSCKLRPPDDELENPVNTTSRKTQKKSDQSNQTRHKRTLGEIRALKCYLCDETESYSILEMKIHFASKHPGQNPYKCVTCERTFADHANNKKHQKTHDESIYNGEPQHKCEICCKKFRLVHTLYHHRRYSHMGITRVRRRNPLIKTTSMSCDICGKTFGALNKLRRHKGLFHHENRELYLSFICKICEKPCSSSTSARQHEKTHKPNAIHRTFFQHKCAECPDHLGFSRKEHIRKHYKEIHPKLEIPKFLISLKKTRKILVCPKCPSGKEASFYNLKPLKRHIEIHHGKNPLPYRGPWKTKEQKLLNKSRVRLEKRDVTTDIYSDGSEAETNHSSSRVNDEELTSTWKLRTRVGAPDCDSELSQAKVNIELKEFSICLKRIDDSHPFSNKKISSETQMHKNQPPLNLGTVPSLPERNDSGDSTTTTKPKAVMTLNKIAAFMKIGKTENSCSNK